MTSKKGQKTIEAIAKNGVSFFVATFYTHCIERDREEAGSMQASFWWFLADSLFSTVQSAGSLKYGFGLGGL